ncbi:DNA topoisomerase III [Gracilibacillus halophilus YIM-C55.5]|uniref:DNA topoisomerase 3 n=1 Tax=Gracilibacillus halophilus YIM-C55.5 TaxID=1308866 RepID=N4WEK9_9BACI|nr:DNA topoisomerase III [Gracilibacillus halophilus]ENH97689.1 DNA topoisomerase III [Gracilibacillus halophilus YIM-C55.5]
MSKTVVLAEKPSVGRDIARVLNCGKKHNGYMEGSKYIVTWALGHLVTLADPGAYDDKYKTWKLDDLPMLPEQLKLVVIKKTGKQFQTVKSQLTRKDVDQVVIATDAGREGELVARWILHKAHVKKPVKRLWISSVTDQAIRQGFQQLKPGKQYENLYASAVARSEADWYVGLNATRALTTKFNAQLSTGRVQTPTLAMIARREQEIKQFQPQPFYQLKAKTKDGIRLTWKNQNNQSRIFDQKQAQRLREQLNGQDAVVKQVDKKRKKQYAPSLYDLTDLQRDANRIFGFSGKQTLSIMQKLYEQHKVVTYPRTDSKYLSTDIVPTLKERVDACGVGPYAKAAAQIKKQPIQTNKSFVHNDKVSDHHAIIPTEERVRLDKLSHQEQKIYDLVVKRFLAVLLPPYEYEQIDVTAEIGGETFTARGNNELKQGFKAVFATNDEQEETEQPMTTVEKDMRWKQPKIALEEGETQPPERFTEGTLLQAMENPSKFMDHSKQQATQTLKATGGLGTVATRADIIEKLFNTFYIEKKGKYLYLTSKGKQLLDLVPEELRSPLLTAEWEEKLAKIANGTLDKQSFIGEIKGYTKQVVQEIKTSDAKYKHDNMTGTKCPSCGQLMLEVNGKKGRMLVCQDRSCGERKPIAKKTNARCPKCHKKMELRGQGEAQTFSCVCGYREKMSAFQKRKNQQGQEKASKRDVNKYMKQQDDEFTNPALAEALSKLKKQDE